MVLYNKPDEIKAIVFGTLLRTEAAVRTTKFNKIITRLGVGEKFNPDTLRELASELQSGENPELKGLVEKAINNELNLENLQHVSDGSYPFIKGNYFDVVTPYSVDRQRTLDMTREFNKAVRTGSYMQILMEDLKGYLKIHLEEASKNMPKDRNLANKVHNEQPKEKEGPSIVLGLSDWHIGSVVGTGMAHGGYDYQIFLDRMERYLCHVDEVIKNKGAKEVVIVHGGDIIESNEMRKNQSFETEFSLSEQIAVATKEMVKIINRYTDIPVRVVMIAGNHDRLSGIGNKKDRIYNDNVTYSILEVLKMMKETGSLMDNVEIIDNTEDTLTASIEVAGKNLFAIHGDTFRGKGSQISSFIKDRPIDIMFSGHIHHFNIYQGDGDELHVVGSSPMGNNSN